MEELKLRCGFLTTVMYSLFIELFLDEKVPCSDHFRVRKELAHHVRRCFRKNPILWDRSAYDMLYLNDFKPFSEPAKTRGCYFKESLLLFFPPDTKIHSMVCLPC